MRVIRLGGSGWRSPEDFYSALLLKLGAPAWHGHNLDALEESLRDGDINQLGPPFSVVVESAPRDMSVFLTKVAEVFNDVRTTVQPEIVFEIF